MASLSAVVRSPSSLSQQQQSYQRLQQEQLERTNGIYGVSPCTPTSTCSIVVARNFLQHRHHRQCSISSSSSSTAFVGKGRAENNYGGDGDDNISLVSCSSYRPNESGGNCKIVHESDFSSPTSWEFRSSCSHLSRPPLTPYHHFAAIQMPATAASASSPMLLPLSLPPQPSSSSGGSSVSTTPSPLEENGPGNSSSYYPFPMQLSLLRNKNNSNGPTPVGTQHASVLSVRDVNVSSNKSGNCSCAPLPNISQSTVVTNGGGGEELILSSHDLTNGNGSDGSRNSTGSHRSQDSGFSDSGETRRRKSSNGNSSEVAIIISSPVAHGSHLNGAHVLNDSINHNHSLHPSPRDSMAGHYHQQQEQLQLLQQHHPFHNGAGDYDYDCGDHSNCCGTINAPHLPPHVQNVYGSCSPALHHHLHNGGSHIYDCLSSQNMPSPILSAGFGMGRLVAHNGHQQRNGHENGTILSKRPTPPRRPASVDISTLDCRANSNGFVISRRRSPSPSSPSAASCTNCLSTSIHFHNQMQQQRDRQRRSFSPSRSHDISALASSSTATAMAALQVPLSSSTPKRGSHASASPSTSTSSTRLLLGNNGNMNMVKIDNFESLNKNVNKDNNNNSSGGGSSSNTPGKKGNKTFSIQANSEHNKDSGANASSTSQLSNNVNANGTVLAEDSSQHNKGYPKGSSVQREVAHHQTKQSRGRTAAESIYDKICSRLSSFSSSTSSSGSAVLDSPSATFTENQTAVLLPKSNNNNINNNSNPNCNNSKALSLSSSSAQNAESITTNGFADSLHCDASSQSSKTVMTSNSKSIHSLVPAENFEGQTPPATCSLTSSSTSSSKFKLFHRTNSQKSLSLPRGLSSNRLSIFDEGDVPIDIQAKHEEGEQAIGFHKAISTSTSTQTISPVVPWKVVEQQADSQVVRLWLKDLRTQTEQECLHSLQTKWIVPVDYSQCDEDDDCHDDLLESIQTNTDSRSISPATSSTITTGDTIASTTTGGHHGTISSSSSSLASTKKQQHHHENNFHEKPVSTSPPQSLASEDYVIGPMVSSSVRFLNSNANNLSSQNKNNVKPSSSTSYVARHRQRRSQQKFLSSMTAAIHAVSTPLMSIRNVEMTANIISGEFSKICKHMEFGIFTQVPTLVLGLVGHIEDFLRGFHCHTKIGGTFASLKKLESRLENACVALEMAAKSMNETALMISSSNESGNNGPVLGLPARLSGCTSSSSSHTTPISSPDCLPNGGSVRIGNEAVGGGGGGDPFLVLSTPSPFPSDQEPESLDKQQYHLVVGEVVEGIVTVGNLFSQVVDLRLTRDLASILDTIEGGGIPGRIALKSLATVLADGGNHICRLAADIRTVRGLLGVLLDTREDQDKILALRCLATVLCVGEAVKDFDKAGGFEIIADLLYDSAYSMWMKIEAVAVLTQATDPWIDLESTLMTLGVHLEKFIVSLTKLIREFKTEEEPFLLIVAAISNLTFLEVASTEYLKRCRTVSFLIDAVHGGNANFSVFVLDHIATILANMAGVDSCRQEIIQCGGIDALLKFLQHRPSLPGKTDTISAITACERLQQKSTIAISRLANEDGVARYVFDMGGVHRLVTLCRNEKERNFSDGVLIAALATLRKLVSICGDEAVKGLGGAEDLIEPRLLDSFLLYSSRQESYV